MGNAVLDGRAFRLDPSSISWDFSINTKETHTIGGKVVQVFGTRMGDITLEGDFGVGGWQEQERFLDRIKALGDKALDDWPNSEGEPIRFFWPVNRWDFKVWIREFTQVGSQYSVEMANEEHAPRWRLVLFPVDDNASLRKVSEDAYIARLAAGIGWKRTQYNGPTGPEEVQAVLAAQGVSTFHEYLSMGYGIAAPASAVVDAAATAPTDITEIQAYAQQKAESDYGWTGAQWNALYEIVSRESSWKPTADNPSSTAYGLFQFLDSTWDDVGGTKTDDPRKQIDYGLKYIKNRYTTPVAALAHHDKNGWY